MSGKDGGGAEPGPIIPTGGEESCGEKGATWPSIEISPTS